MEELAVLPEVRQAVQHTEFVEFLLERLDDVAHSDDTVVVYQAGGYGVEPVLYVLGPDAPSVVATVRETL